MWVFLNDAFVSVVRDTRDASGQRLLVRARRRADLERFLRPHCVFRIEWTEDADYRWRASVPRAAVMAALAERVDSLDYPNFKDSVWDKERAGVYMRVWSAGLDLEPGRPARWAWRPDPDEPPPDPWAIPD